MRKLDSEVTIRVCCVQEWPDWNFGVINSLVSLHMLRVSLKFQPGREWVH